jgi:hypothetical protein
VYFEAQGEQKTYLLANKWNQPNTTMRDLGSTFDMVAVIPQDEALNLDIKFYFSKVSGTREEALENPESASNKFNTLIVIPFSLCHIYPLITIP